MLGKREGVLPTPRGAAEDKSHAMHDVPGPGDMVQSHGDSEMAAVGIAINWFM